MKKLILIFCLIGCGSNSSWSKASETSFLNRCSATSMPPQLCLCMLHSVEDQMTEPEFIAADARAQRDGREYPELYKAFTDCAK